MAKNEVLSKELFLFVNKTATDLASYDAADNVILGCVSDFSIDKNKATIPIECMSDQDPWTKTRGGNKSWALSTNGTVTRVPTPDDGLYHYETILSDFLDSDEPIIWGVSSIEVGDTYEYGYGTLTTLNKSGAIGAAATYSLSIEGYGPLVAALVAAPAATVVAKKSK